MRILFLRHGDPNYETDSLLETGKIEAELLSQKLINEKIDYFYQSPLGRAKETASYTLSKLGKEATTYEWMKEFGAIVRTHESEFLKEVYPDTQENGLRIAWDMLPRGYKDDENYYTLEGLAKTELAKHSNLMEELDRVYREFDALLERHGYKREGNLYRCKNGNDDTIAIFCHFGVTCVFLSRLLGISPFLLWQGTAFAPTSVTEVYTEEREKGFVNFRATKLGDVSHLYVANTQPSFSARFCETFEKEDERH